MTFVALIICSSRRAATANHQPTRSTRLRGTAINLVWLIGRLDGITVHPSGQCPVHLCFSLGDCRGVSQPGVWYGREDPSFKGGVRV